jgi:putative MATE family efflux protein
MRGGSRRIWALTLPALGVLAAEPLYVLIDTAVAGHLGTAQLGGLALGGAVLSLLPAVANFLAYGTTSRAARLYGAGRRADAVAEGIQASWLAVGLGLVVLVLVEVFAGPLTGLLAGHGSPAVHAAAQRWLRIAVLGAPCILLTLAGNGWMRGVQITRRPLVYVLGANGLSAVLCPLLVYPAGMGLTGSAVANVAAQSVSAGFFVRGLLAERTRLGLPLRPRPDVLAGQLVLARDLVVRVVALQGAFLSAAAVASRLGPHQLAAHQIALQLWIFLSLVLDAYAIAAQSLVGAAIGAGDGAEARRCAWTVAGYGAGTGAVVALALLAGWTAIPRLFSGDPAVLSQAHVVWPWFAAMQPAAGVVFALDGVLIGAGDIRFLRTITILAAACGFLPMVWLTYALRHEVGWGLAGVWCGLTLFIGIRLAGMLARVWRGRWTESAVEGQVAA